MKNIVPVEIRSDGMGGYMYDGYGKLETALEMRRWNKKYNQKRHLQKRSYEKLKSWLQDNGYEIVTQSVHEISVQTSGLFAKLYIDPQDNGIIAQYEITDYYGVYDNTLMDNETYMLD